MSSPDSTLPVFAAKPTNPRFQDIEEGATINSLTVLGFAGMLPTQPSRADSNRAAYWWCRCVCGKILTVRGSALTREKLSAQSCGCVRSENSRKAHFKHGYGRDPLYAIWKSMVDRCHNPNNRAYADYGGRGIYVCDEWRDDFMQFMADVGRPPEGDRYTLDRRDNNAGYNPSNVHWATYSQQSRNRRTNRLITYDGRTQCVQDWAAEAGISGDTLRARLRMKWPMDRAMKTPVAGIYADVPHEVKLKARIALTAAINRGALIRPATCQYLGCSCTEVLGHHHLGYDPENHLDVLWLCRTHHKQAERDRTISETIVERLRVEAYARPRRRLPRFPSLELPF